MTFDNLLIDQRHDAGLAIDNASGAVTVSGTTTINNEANATQSALSITNSSAAMTFTGPVTVANATGSPGVNLQNNSGTTTFGSLNVASTNGTALYADSAGTLDISSSTNGTSGGTIQATNGTAVDLENTALNVNLESVSSSGASVGLKLLSTTGSFLSLATAAELWAPAERSRRRNHGVLAQNADTVGLVSMKFISNGVAVQGQNVSYLGLANDQITSSTSTAWTLST